MTDLEKSQRKAVVDEALSWLKTPYHHAQSLKGAGVDCALFLAAVFENAGLIPKIEWDYYPADWHIHNNDQLYLKHVLQYGRKVDLDGRFEKNQWIGEKPLPGDIAMYQFGRCTAHGAIVVEWPMLIHARLNLMVMLEEAFNPALAKEFRGIYRYKGWS